MALDLVEIRAILTGGKQVSAEADAMAASLGNTGKAAAKANEQAAASGAKATGSIKKTSGSIKELGRSMTHYITLPLLAIGAASVDMAAKFDRSILLLHTQAGVAKRELGGLRKEFLKISRETTFSPLEISEAGYRLAGAGIRGDALKQATRASAQLAMVGDANPEDTAKTIAQVWYQNIKGAGDFNHIIGEINATVGAGDLRLPQLIDALGTGVVASAKQAGLSMQDLNAALAVFGDSTNNVSGWSAQFATALHFFTAPTEKAKSAMEALGLESMQLSEDFGKPNGLVRGLRDLKSHLDALPGGMMGTEAKMRLGEILPGGRGRVLSNLLNAIPKVEEKLVSIKDTTDRFHQSVRETEQQPMVRLENAWSNIQADLVELGETLIPIVVPGLEAVAGAISSIASAFQGMNGPMKEAVGILLPTLMAVGPAILLGGKLSKVGTGLKGAFGGKSTFAGRLGVGTLGVGASQAAGNALGGDLGNWVSKAGTGASAGFAVGGPFGALAGGAIGGGLAAYEKLFSTEKRLTWSQQQLARDSKSVAAGMNAQRAAGASLTGSGQRLARSQKHVETTSEGLHRAERRLTNAYRDGHGDRRTVLRDEQRITIAQHSHVEAIHKLHRAEKLSKVAASQYKTIARANILEERNEINVLGRKHAALNNAYVQSVKNHEGLKKQNELAQRAQGVEGKLTEAHKKMATTLEETSNKIGPGYSHWLEHATQEMLNFGSAIKAAEESIGGLGENLAPGALGPLGLITNSPEPVGKGRRHGLDVEPGKHVTRPENGGKGAQDRRLHATVILPNGKVLAEVQTKASEDAKARL